MKRVILMNAAVATTPGVYELTPATADEVLELLTSDDTEVCSYIGHQATAAVMETLLGVPIPVNRGMYRHEVGDEVVVFRLLQRMPEGTILNAEEIEAVGYELMKFNRIA